MNRLIKLVITFAIATLVTACVAVSTPTATPLQGCILMPVESPARVGGVDLRVLISPPGTDSFTWIVMPNAEATLHVAGRDVVLKKAAVYGGQGELLDVQEGSTYTLTVPADGLAGGVGIRPAAGGGITLTVNTESIFVPMPTE